MAFALPDTTQLQHLAAELNFSLDEQQAQQMLELLQPFAAGYEYLDQRLDELPVARRGGRDYRYPRADENPFGAWLLKCHISGARPGPLSGKRVAVKDNIFVAELPVTNGRGARSGLTADFDATTVARVLDAGADIVGKTVCEYMCMSGGSATSAGGIVQNPRKPGYSTGGSSSGSAALVAAGAVDMALGTDQGGSVRIPASWSGVVGMKATRGVVPFDGGIPMESSIEYIGPLTHNVADNALLLEVLADGGAGARPDYSSGLDGSVAGLRIAVLQEGFDWPACTAEVQRCVRDAASRFTALGATVEQVSVPEHLNGPALWGAVVTDGFWQTMKLNGAGYNHDDIYSPALRQAMQNWTSHSAEAPLNAQLLWLLGRHLEGYQGRYYARAKNLVRKLRMDYDKCLQDHDLLLLPTTVTTADRNPESQSAASVDEIMGPAFNNTLNACQFNATGHPAISIPCGRIDGLPVGLMLVGRYFSEKTIYRAAYAFEQSVDWRTAE